MKSQPDVGEVAKLLQKELQRRFKKFTDPGEEDYNPLFVMATVLDPRYRVLLNTVQLQSAEHLLLKEVSIHTTP